MNTASWLPRQLLTHWLNLALTVPLIYQLIGLPLMMREHDWSGTQIGLMQMTGVPALGKLLLATPVDCWQLDWDSYCNWGMLLAVGYIGALPLGAHDLTDTPFALLFVLAMSVSLFGTWVDMPVNALTIRILPQIQHMPAGAIRSTATCLGAIVGGGPILILYNHMGWASPFYVLSLGVLLAMLLIPLPTAPAGLNTPPPRRPRHVDATDMRPAMAGVVLGAPAPRLDRTTDLLFPVDRHRMSVPQTTDARPGFQPGTHCTVGRRGWQDSGCWLHIAQMGSTRCVAFVCCLQPAGTRDDSGKHTAGLEP